MKQVLISHCWNKRRNEITLFVQKTVKCARSLVESKLDYPKCTNNFMYFRDCYFIYFCLNRIPILRVTCTPNCLTFIWTDFLKNKLQTFGIYFQVSHSVNFTHLLQILFKKCSWIQKNRCKINGSCERYIK